MILSKLLGALNNSIDKRELLTQIQEYRLTLQQHYTPMLTDLKALNSSANLDTSNRILSNIQEQFNSVNPRWKSNYVGIMSASAAAMDKQLDVLEDAVGHIKATHIVKDVMDVRTAALVKYISNLDVFFSFGNMLTSVTLDQLTFGINKHVDLSLSDLYIKNELSPAKVKYFATYCDSLVKNTKGLEREIRALPEYAIEMDIHGNVTNMNVISSSLSGGFLDSLGVGGILSVLNPFRFVYGIRKGISDIRMIFYQNRKNELKMLDEKLLRYKMLREQGHSNTRTDKVIDNIERDVQQRQAKLNDWREDIEATDKGML